MTIEFIHEACNNRNVLWSVHVLARLQERGIFRYDVIHALQTGEIIEHYPDDFPNPSCLILGTTSKSKPLHVVCASNDEGIKIITAYYPTPDKFCDDNRTRRSDNQ